MDTGCETVVREEHEDARTHPNDGRARRRVGGPKPKLRPRQIQIARQMYDQLDENGHNRWTVAQIAAEFDVSRPTIYRYLD